MNTIKKTLNDFAHDLVNHCTTVVDGQITLSEEGLKKLILLYSKDNDPIIWPITLEMIQEEADQELDRPLTDIEINRFKEMYFDDEDVSWKRMVMIRDAIEVAVDNSKHEWDEIDKDFEEEKLKGGEK